MNALADYVTSQAPSISLGDISDMFRVRDTNNPIDTYKKRSMDILRYGSPERLSEHDMVGRLLVLNLVSVTEAYFRLILSLVIELCPISQSISSEKAINLGGMLWHGRSGFSRSAFDHVSFSNSDDLKKTCQAYIGFGLRPDKFSVPLTEFDRVCHIRHGIVHNDGVLPGRNAVKLNIGRQDSDLVTVVDFRRLQEIAAVSDTLVTTFNRELFELMCKRWAVDWRNRPDWEPGNSTKMFNRMWNIFASKQDINLSPNRGRLRRKDCLSAVKEHFDIS